MTTGAHERRRRLLRAVAMLIFTVTLLVAMLAGWARHSLFDSHALAVRSLATLDSSAVRHELAEQITDQILVQSDSSLASYPVEARRVVSDIIETDAFRMAFHTAVEEVHRTVMLRRENKALLQLGASLAVLSGSAEDASPGMAQRVPHDLDSLLVDVALHPSRWGEEHTPTVGA